MNPIQQRIRRFSHWLLAVTDSWEPVERVLSQALETELLAHPGQWVAMTRERLLASGDDQIEVLNAARAQGVETPILYRVPEPGTSWFLATSGS
jgi:hypothetical protein